MSNMSGVHIAIVGAGPRGTSTLERIIASARLLLRQGTRLTIHVIDPYPPGAGRIWRIDQPPRLLMNTSASQVTLFTDSSVTCDGPTGKEHWGPNLHKWGEDADGFRLGENDYATRSQHGQYLEWVFHEVCRRAKSHSIVRGFDIHVKTHRAKAIQLENEPKSHEDDAKCHDDDSESHDGVSKSHGDHVRQVLTLVEILSNGVVLKRTLDGLSAVILTQGHVHRDHTDEQKLFLQHIKRSPEARYFPPGNPADINFDTIKPDEVVFLRGLGLVFVDYMILLTARRGGWFERQEDGSFKYHPSGREPRIIAGSRRGIPYHAKPIDQKIVGDIFKPQFLTEKAVEGLKNRKPLQFKDNVWPLISKEVKFVYYKTLIGKKQLPVEDEELASLIKPDDGDEESLLEKKWVTREELWSWQSLRRPQGDRKFPTLEKWNEWLCDYLRSDVREAKEGNVCSPQKAALDVLREVRNSVREVVNYGLADKGLKDFTELNAFLTTGPPRRRIEQMIALMDANILQVVGPAPEVKFDKDHWRVTCENPPYHQDVKTLIEAFIPSSELNHTADELLQFLRGKKECRPHRIGTYETGAIDITKEPYHIIKHSGEYHPRRFSIGVPSEGLHWLTTIQPRPGADSVNLRQTDAIARAALKLACKDFGRQGKYTVGLISSSAWSEPCLAPSYDAGEGDPFQVCLRPKSHSVEGHTSQCTLSFDGVKIWGPVSCHDNSTQIRDALQAADPRFTLAISDKAKTLEGHTKTISITCGDRVYLNGLSTHNNMAGLCQAINECLSRRPRNL